MKKIIEFITNLSDGGAENLVKEYACLLDRSRFDVCVVTIRNITDTAVYRTLKEEGIRIKTVYPKWNLLVKVFNKFFGKKYIDYKLKKIFIKEEKADVIHAHLYVLKYLSRITDDLRGIKMFYTCHSIPEKYFGTDYPVQTKIAKKLIRQNDMRLIALHDEMKTELDKMFHVNTTAVIHNGIDFERFKIKDDSGKIVRKGLGISEDCFVVGHVGRFVEAKNHRFLIDVFRKIVEKQPNSMLILIGNGQLEREIKDRVDNYGLTDKVVFLSHRTDIPELMSAMDVFVFPSLFEGLGIVLVEAQLSGLRCIVSDKVPTEAYLSNLVVPISLTDEVDKWADIVLNKEYLSDLPNKINEYDIRCEIKKLEELYSQ